ncbi:MAG: transcription elongation factor subunit Spt4 [archaeon]|jgi:DNA-directed RNA polymerase subunit E"|nr:DNA-directed RNA polymerase subunit E'' [Euryarchaeota archaeon]MDP6703884.1 transcription elongation factor subunit Spt4 [archaeon]|tara:strand:- start:16028 stop:16210 length:183 start_codon:yes stop_codon:yes gene_type:complete
MSKACKACSRLNESNVCVACGATDFSSRWNGLVIIINPEKSVVAEKLGIKEKGEYALSVQ